MAFGRHWEWRGFGRLPPRLRAALEALPPLFPEAQELTDEYLWVPGSSINVKLRFQDLKLKRLLQVTGGLERWLEDTGENHAFPLGPDVIRKVAAELNIVLPEFPSSPLDREGLLALLARASPPVKLIPVHKVRRQMKWPGDDPDPVTVEVADILSPERTVSVGLEHELPGKVDAAQRAFALEESLTRLSYLGALALWGRGGTLGPASRPA